MKKEDIVAREGKLFYSVCDPEQEPVLTILRTHLLTEHYLERIIALVLSRGDRVLSGGNLTYAQKVSLVESFDLLEDSLVQSLKNLNKVRNECAHEIHKTITLSEVESIGRPFGKRFTPNRREYADDVPKLLHYTLMMACAGMAGHIMTLEEEQLEKEESSDEG